MTFIFNKKAGPAARLFLYPAFLPENADGAIKPPFSARAEIFSISSCVRLSFMENTWVNRERSSMVER